MDVVDCGGLPPLCGGGSLLPVVRSNLRVPHTMTPALSTAEESQSGSRWYDMPADQGVEAMMAAMKLGGVDRVWFVSGSEIGVLQEAAVKNAELGRPTPKITDLRLADLAIAPDERCSRYRPAVVEGPAVAGTTRCRRRPR